MKADTEGIVLRETKTSYNRRMILLFTREYGKISAGTNLGERGKSKSARQEIEALLGTKVFLETTATTSTARRS